MHELTNYVGQMDEENKIWAAAKIKKESWDRWPHYPDGLVIAKYYPEIKPKLIKLLKEEIDNNKDRPQEIEWIRRELKELNDV